MNCKCILIRSVSIVDVLFNYNLCKVPWPEMLDTHALLTRSACAMSGHAMAPIFTDFSEKTVLKSSLPHYSKAKSKLFTDNLLAINET